MSYEDLDDPQMKERRLEEERLKRKAQRRKERIWWLIATPILFVLAFVIVYFLEYVRGGSSSTYRPFGCHTEGPAHAQQYACGWTAATKYHDIESGPAGIHAKNCGYLLNFNDTVAAGTAENGRAVQAEAGAGFILSVNDADSVTLTFYNHTDEDIRPEYVSANVGKKTWSSQKDRDTYKVAGYAKCGDGCGTVSMRLSNGWTLYAAVFKQDGMLYAANLYPQKTAAETALKGEKALDDLLEKYGVTPEGALGLDDIYYPIVPVAEGEKTDVQPWVEQSDEIVEEGWSAPRKAYELYLWCAENLAYDYWVLDAGDHSRSFYYNDFSGKFYMSRTHVGVCEDFSQAYAIMCRAQGIPAVVLASKEHAWNAVWIEDYGRWIAVDITPDVVHTANEKDAANWDDCPGTVLGYSYCTPAGGTGADETYIGNASDMRLQGIPVRRQ